MVNLEETIFGSVAENVIKKSPVTELSMASTALLIKTSVCVVRKFFISMRIGLTISR